MTDRRINVNVSVDFDHADFTVTQRASASPDGTAGARRGRRSFGGAPVA